MMSTLYAGFHPLTVTAETGSTATTTTMFCPELKSTLLGADHFVGAWLFIDSTTASAAPEGECRRIVGYDPATGTLTVDPGFTVAPDDSIAATGEIHYWLHPDRLVESINRALEVGSQRAYAAISQADEDNAAAIYDQDILIEGALFYANKALLRRILRGGAGPSIDRVKAQMNIHLENWQRGLRERLGYIPPGFGYYGAYKEGR